MNEIVGIIATILAVGGVVLNNRKMAACFYLWIISNILSAYIHWSSNTNSLMVRDLIFLVLAIEGISRWSQK